MTVEAPLKGFVGLLCNTRDGKGINFYVFGNTEVLKYNYDLMFLIGWRVLA